MKYIFDFDDVLFYTTKRLKEKMYECLEEAGISRVVAESHYKEAREDEFSLKNSLLGLFKNQKITDPTAEVVYEKIMLDCKDFTNVELIQKIKTLGKENCFILTNGEKQFQEDKISRSGIAPLFSEVFIVPGTKREVIRDMCARYKEEKVLFIEDKVKFIEDIDLAECPNLKPVLYDIEASLDASPI